MIKSVISIFQLKRKAYFFKSIIVGNSQHTLKI
jgi:hypothetical protein